MKKLLTITLVVIIGFAFTSLKLNGQNNAKSLKTKNLTTIGTEAFQSSKIRIENNEQSKFVPSISEQKSKSALSEGFEGTTFPPTDWKVINGGDANTWVRYTTTPHTGSACAAISYGSTAHDDYLITPKLAITAGDYTLTAWFKSQSASYLEPYDVMVSTTGNNAGDFTLFQAAPDPGTTWVQKTYDFSSYAGQNIYVAFRSTTTDMFRLYIDDVAGPAIYAADDDAGVLSINIASVITPGAFDPSVTVKNFGALPQDFEVELKINDGSTDIYTQNQTVTALAGGTTSVLTFPNWTAALGNYTATVTVTNVGDMDASNNVATKSFSVQNLTKAYAWSTGGYSTIPAGPSYFYLQQPGTWYNIATVTTTNVYAGSWALGVWYASDNTTGSLISINTTDGSLTTIGSFGLAGTGMNGMAFDITTNTMYGVTSTDLYTIDLNTGAATLVGASGVSGAVFLNLACSNNGELYAVDNTTDKLFQLDPTTGVGTAIGTGIGFNIQYAQDMEWDHDNNVLYLAAYLGGGVSHLHTIDVTTGVASASLGNFPSNEVCGFAIPYVAEGANITFHVTDGTNAIENAAVTVNGVTKNTDAAGDATYYLPVGSYPYSVTKFGFSDFTSTSDVVVVDGVDQTIPVALSSLSNFDVTFTVTNNIPSPLLGAAIAVTQGGVTLNGTTDASGVYTFANLPVGTYSYGVSLAGYITQSGTFDVVSAAVPVNITLLENMVLPYGLLVTDDGTDATFTWNNTFGLASFTDGFEDGTFDAWDEFIQGPGTAGDNPNNWWVAGAAATPYEGVNSAHVDWGYTVDTWIITPEIAVTAGMNVNFAFNMSYYWMVTPNANGDLFVKISTDGGSTWTTLWREEDFGTYTDWTWTDVSIPLTAYAGQTAKIAFNLVSNDAADVDIDAIDISDPTKSLTGYNVYLDNMTTPVATNVVGTSYTFLNPGAGFHTAGVSSVYTTGTSSIVTLDWTMTNTNNLVANKMKLYPTPTKGKINIENLSNANVYVTNMLGTVVASRENVTGSTIFDLSNVAKGIYMVKIVSDNKTITKKVNVID